MPTTAELWNRWWDEGVRVLVVETWDEEAVRSAAAQLAEIREVPFWEWSRVSGLIRPGESLGGTLTREPETLLDKVHAMPSGVVVAWDLWDESVSAAAVRAVRETAQRSAPVMFLTVSPPGTAIPESLSRVVVKTQVGDPSGPFFRRWMKSQDRLLARQAHHQDVDRPGLVAASPVPGWEEVGGLRHLRQWADERRLALDPTRGLPFPRGVLLYGIPGTGKSLSVKAWAGSWGIPLLRLDWGGLMGRYVGQSEERLAQALATAERLAPSILWVDEIDRALSGSASLDDSGVTRRLVGALLTWLSEHREPVLLLACANNVADLPGELLRPGRFDALFFVDLPDVHARREILAILLKQQGVSQTPDIMSVAETLEDFSGSDIQAVVTDALFLAAMDGRPLGLGHLQEASARTIPWARTLGTELEARREWARGRLRFA